MKFLLCFFLLAISQVCFAQFVDNKTYDLHAPIISDSIDPNKKTVGSRGGFFYDQKKMKKATFINKTYEEGVLFSENVIKLPIDENYTGPDLIGIAIDNNLYIPPVDSFFYDDEQNREIKADTIMYVPKNNEVLYHSDIDSLLGEVSNNDTSLHELYFKNNGRIIAKKTIDTFTKFYYDSFGNITKTLAFRGAEYIRTADEYLQNGHSFQIEPTDYTLTQYDDRQRIQYKWISINENLANGFIFDMEGCVYDCTRYLVNEEFKYNDQDQITSIKTTIYQLKKEWESTENTQVYLTVNAFAHPNINSLEPLLYGKTEEILHYTYDTSGSVVREKNTKVIWLKSNNNWSKKSTNVNFERNVVYTDDKVTVETYSMSSSLNEKEIKEKYFEKVVYNYNKENELVKKESFLKHHQNDKYKLSFSETLTFD